MKLNLRQLTSILLFYTLLVILWGAWVRISHSGDGCGNHWPLCNGNLIPNGAGGKTWVEYTHRLMSGIYGLFVVFIWWHARKAPHLKRAATAVLIFMITEALLGAKLVLLGLVRDNDSPLRAMSMSLHFVNSLLLVGSTTVLREMCVSQNHPASKPLPRFASLLIGAFFILGVSGAIAALSSTLFPSLSLETGIAQDLDSGSHYLLRLRIFHPILGLLVGGTLAWLPWMFSFENPKVRDSSRALSIAACLGVVFGVLTLVFLSPLWMKLTHLFIAHVVWICLVRWLFWFKASDRSPRSP